MANDSLTKICNKCNKDLSIDEYEPRKASKDGRRSICRDCRFTQRYGKERYLHKRWRTTEGTKEKKCSVCDKWQVIDGNYSPSKTGKFGVSSICKPCQVIKTLESKAKSDPNGNKQRKAMQNYRANDPDKYNGHAVEYRNRNKERISERRKERTRADPMYHLTNTMRGLISYSLKGRKRDGRLVRLLKYSIKDLKSHLENQFRDGMSWDNYGKWHVDHIRPISSFNYKSMNDDEFHECWALSNLQPLWAQENQRKHAKYNANETRN